MSLDPAAKSRLVAWIRIFEDGSVVSDGTRVQPGASASLAADLRAALDAHQAASSADTKKSGQEGLR